ncbi:unnamed protein product [Gongylonema pulchrum]|uniref:Uncharacterized protein n=1 Tax=Gongylonema pulchrum TaxID=637853 RepID=A0A183E8G5_9BILA|nr:unnamed protein product [Gongylonema pulchrum]
MFAAHNEDRVPKMSTDLHLRHDLGYFEDICSEVDIYWISCENISALRWTGSCDVWKMAGNNEEKKVMYDEDWRVGLDRRVAGVIEEAD